ncbi:hypothetical protein AA983_08720 [Dermacoccus sp. PE3]|nr:hypothetical protein AA983_08720 [Dermacoccus sp. PE3]
MRRALERTRRPSVARGVRRDLALLTTLALAGSVPLASNRNGLRAALVGAARTLGQGPAVSLGAAGVDDERVIVRGHSGRPGATVLGTRRAGRAAGVIRVRHPPRVGGRFRDWADIAFARRVSTSVMEGASA